jgi:hypothetical protein
MVPVEVIAWATRTAGNEAPCIDTEVPMVFYDDE